jgi:hypothetical protein
MMFAVRKKNLSMAFVVFNLVFLGSGSAVSAADLYAGKLQTRRTCSFTKDLKMKCQNQVLPKDKRCFLTVYGAVDQPGVAVNASIYGVQETRDVGDIHMGQMSRLEIRNNWLIFNAFEGDRRNLVVKLEKNKPVGFEMRLDQTVVTSTFEATAFKGLQCVGLRKIR